MPDAASFAIQVSNLATGIAFLTEKLGFTLTEAKPAEDITYLLDTDGDPMLLPAHTPPSRSRSPARSHPVTSPARVSSLRAHHISVHPGPSRSARHAGVYLRHQRQYASHRATSSEL